MIYYCKVSFCFIQYQVTFNIMKVKRGKKLLNPQLCKGTLHLQWHTPFHKSNSYTPNFVSNSEAWSPLIKRARGGGLSSLRKLYIPMLRPSVLICKIKKQNKEKSGFSSIVIDLIMCLLTQVNCKNTKVSV